MDIKILNISLTNLKCRGECRDRRGVKVVCAASGCRCRELPELVIVVLRPYQRGHHGEGSRIGAIRNIMKIRILPLQAPVERSVCSGVDEELVGQGGSVACA